MRFRILLMIVMALHTASCSFVLDVGLEPVSTATLTSTSTPTALPTSTPTITPTPLPTHTPSPTPLPGSVVVPVASLGKDIPWLPLDMNRYPVTHIVMFNTELPPFNNPLVRQAFAAAIDRELITALALKYFAVDPSPATTFLPPVTLGRSLYGEVGINFDPLRAKDLLTQAGYTDPASFPGVSFIVNYYGETAPGARLNMATAMAEMWQTHLGVAVDVQALGRVAFKDRITSNPPELIWVGWLPDPGNDPDYIRDIFMTDAQYNYGHFSNFDFNGLVSRAGLIKDPAARQALYIEAERLLCETEAAILPLYFTFQDFE